MPVLFCGEEGVDDSEEAADKRLAFLRAGLVADWALAAVRLGFLADRHGLVRGQGLIHGAEPLVSVDGFKSRVYGEIGRFWSQPCCGWIRPPVHGRRICHRRGQICFPSAIPARSASDPSPIWRPKVCGSGIRLMGLYPLSFKILRAGWRSAAARGAWFGSILHARSNGHFGGVRSTAFAPLALPT